MTSVKVKATRAALAATGLAVGAVAVFSLREATLSTHQRVPRDSRVQVVVSARARNLEDDQTLAEAVEAQLVGCRLEVASDIVGEIEDLGDGRFRAVLTPALDQTNRRQFRGCVEDWRLDGLLVDVLQLERLS